jgi:hypothetical protein
MNSSASYGVLACGSQCHGPVTVHEAGRAEPSKPRLLDRVRAAIGLRHYRDPEYAWGYFDLARFQCANGLFDDARRSRDTALQERPGLRAIMEKDREFAGLCGLILK